MGACDQHCFRSLPHPHFRLVIYAWQPRSDSSWDELEHCHLWRRYDIFIGILLFPWKSPLWRPSHLRQNAWPVWSEESVWSKVISRDYDRWILQVVTYTVLNKGIINTTCCLLIFCFLAYILRYCSVAWLCYILCNTSFLIYVFCLFNIYLKFSSICLFIINDRRH